MATEKEIMLIKNIMNMHVGEEEKMLIKKIQNAFEEDNFLSKNLKECFLNSTNFFLNNEKFREEEEFPNMQFDENDKMILKKIQNEGKNKIFPPDLEKVKDDVFDTMLDMNDENLKKFSEKYRDVHF